MADLIDRFIEATRQKRAAEAEVRRLNGELGPLGESIIEMFVNQGTSKITRHGMTIYLNSFTSVTARGGDTAALRRALEEAELQDLIGPNMAKVKSWVKERTDEGDPIPDAVANAMTIATINKVGAREES